MSFIKEIDHENAKGKLKSIYVKMMDQRSGRLPSIFTVLSSSPAALEAVKKLSEVVTFGGSTLGRRIEEIIATYISRLNGCHY